MMNEASDVNSRNIALLTTIANGKVITDANATTDERMTINALLDLYIKKRAPKLASFTANTLPTSPFARKLRAVQTALGIGVDGEFGVDSIMGIVRSTKDPSIDDILDILTPSGGEVPRTASVAELQALIDQGNKGNKPTDLGPRLVGATGTGSRGVEVGPGPKVGVGQTAKVLRTQLVMTYSKERLDSVRRRAIAMQARGEDPLPMIRKELGEKNLQIAGIQADLLLAAIGIKSGDGSSSVPKLTPVTPAPTRDVDLGSGRLIPERKRYRS